MTPSGSPARLINQFGCSPPVVQSHVQGSEWGPSETRVASTLVLLGSPQQEQEGGQFSGRPNQYPYHSSSVSTLNNQPSGSHFPYTSLYSTPVDQVNLDPGAEDDLFAFFEFDSSFVSDSEFTSLNPTQDDMQLPSDPEWGSGPVLAGGYDVVDNVIRETYDIPGYTLSMFDPSSSLVTNFDPYVSSLSQGMDARFQTTDHCTSQSVDPCLLGLDSDRPVAPILSGNLSIPNPADLAAGMPRSSYPVGPREFDYDVAQSSSHSIGPPAKQEPIPFDGPIYLCEWRDARNGAVCLEVFTLANLPAHLSTHGIKRMSRDHPTKCTWVGCKRKTAMNRESIIRHIREIHLRLKRPLKRAQEPQSLRC